MRLWQFEPRRHHPLYEQVKNEIRARIARGELKPGDRLPPEDDLASQLGVSVITISRALTDLAREGLLCRRRRLGTFVAKKREEFSPRPRGVVGVVVPGFPDSFFPEVARGISDICADRGLMLEIHNTYDDPQREEQALRQMYANGITALIICASAATQRDAFISTLDSTIPTVIVDSWVKGLQSDFVCTADRKGAKHAVQHLLRLGHRRILHLAGRGRISTDRERKRGYLDALREAGIKAEAELIVETFDTFEENYQLCQSLLRKGRKFTAAFAVNDFVASAAIEAFLDSGLRVPQEVAVVGYADLVEFRRFRVPLTTVHQPAYEMGRAAMRMLLERIEEGEAVRRRPRRILLPTELVVRESCGAWLGRDSGRSPVPTKRKTKRSR